MKVLVTGASGYLGWYVATALLERDWTVWGTSRDETGLPEGVLRRALTLDDGGAAGAQLIAQIRPHAVVHLAAIANADRCAQEPDLARTVNVEATRRLAKAASAIGAYLLFSSSDLVFDGAGAPYAEVDPPRPLGPYMATKVDAERAVLETDISHGVARIALLYGIGGGPRGRSFTDHLIAKLEAGEQVNLFEDQWRTPLYVEDAAGLLADLVDARAPGIVHVGGPERVSRLEHGLAIARALDLDAGRCAAIQMSDLEGLSPRPADTSLQIARLEAIVGRTPLSVAVGCAALARRYLG